VTTKDILIEVMKLTPTSKKKRRKKRRKRGKENEIEKKKIKRVICMPATFDDRFSHIQPTNKY
jgi:hypothetical protein